MKKKAILVQEYHARGQCRQVEEECKGAECKQKEKEEALHRQEEMRQMDHEDLERMARLKESREWEEEAQRIAEAELIRRTLAEEEAARAAEFQPRDKNNEVLDYYDDIDQDTEMASSQETVPMTSQESNDTAPMSSQETVPMSSQESKATNPCIQSGVNNSGNIYAQSGDCNWHHHTRRHQRSSNGWDLPGGPHIEVHPTRGEGITEPIAHRIPRPSGGRAMRIFKSDRSPYQ